MEDAIIYLEEEPAAESYCYACGAEKRVHVGLHGAAMQCVHCGGRAFILVDHPKERRLSVRYLFPEAAVHLGPALGLRQVVDVSLRGLSFQMDRLSELAANDLLVGRLRHPGLAMEPTPLRMRVKRTRRGVAACCLNETRRAEQHMAEAIRAMLTHRESGRFAEAASA